jgi:hypothetical protein
MLILGLLHDGNENVLPDTGTDLDHLGDERTDDGDPLEDREPRRELVAAEPRDDLVFRDVRLGLHRGGQHVRLLVDGAATGQQRNENEEEEPHRLCLDPAPPGVRPLPPYSAVG